MAEDLIPGLSDPASAIVFDKLEDITDLVAPKVQGVPVYDPSKVAVSVRRLASDVTLGQLMQVCGDAIEQGDAPNPPDPWETSNGAVGAGRDRSVRELAARRALLQQTTEYLWRSSNRGGLRGAASLLLLPTVRTRAGAADGKQLGPAEASGGSGANTGEIGQPPAAIAAPTPPTPEITQPIIDHLDEKTTASFEEGPLKRARLQAVPSSTGQQAGAGMESRGAPELPLLTDITIRSQDDLVGYPFLMAQSRSARDVFKNPSKSLVNPRVQPPPEPPESSEVEIDEPPVGFNTPWPGPDFKVGQLLPGSVYLWACGEPVQGGNISRVSRCQAFSAWIILISQAMCYVGLWCISGTLPAADSQKKNAEYSFLAVVGAMYLILWISAADVWCGCSLIVEGRGPGFTFFTPRRMFGGFLLGTFITLVGASIRVLFYYAEGDVHLLVGAAAVLFIADVDEKAMTVLKNISGESVLFWVLETIGLSVALALLAINVTGNTDAVDEHDQEHRCSDGGCYIFQWSFILAELPTTVTVFAFMLTSFIGRPTSSFAKLAIFPRWQQFLITLFMLCWLAQGPLWLIHAKASVWFDTVSGGCALVFVMLCYRRELARANEPRKRQKVVPQGRGRLLFLGALLAFLRLGVELVLRFRPHEHSQVHWPKFFVCFTVIDIAVYALSFITNMWLIQLLRFVNLRSSDSDSNVSLISFLRPMLIGWGLSEGFYAIQHWVFTYAWDLEFTYPIIYVGAIFAHQIIYQAWPIIVGTVLWGEAAGVRGVGYWTAISFIRTAVIGGVSTLVFAFIDETVH